MLTITKDCQETLGRNHNKILGAELLQPGSHAVHHTPRYMHTDVQKLVECHAGTLRCACGFTIDCMEETSCMNLSLQTTLPFRASDSSLHHPVFGGSKVLASGDKDMSDALGPSMPRSALQLYCDHTDHTTAAILVDKLRVACAAVSRVRYCGM